MYGNADDYSYHFKYQVCRDQIASLFCDLEWLVKPSAFPDYISEIYVLGSHNVNDVLHRLRKAGFDPVPLDIAEEPWVYRPEEETYEEYVARCGF